MQKDDAAVPTATESPRYRMVVLAMLVLVYTFNFIDRQIVGILAVPIKADLGLTDTQLGLMGGLAFALFYTLLGIPIAMLADRSNRTTIMTVALVVWSAMTAVCGFAQNFWQLFLARLGVGVGEAGGVAPAYSLVADYFPPQQRARALGVYSFGMPIGSALGIVFGGLIAALIDWRTAFIVVGIAGVLLAPVFKMVVREPRARPLRRRGAGGKPPGFGEVMRVLLAQAARSGACRSARRPSSMMGYGLFFWLPSFFVRSYGLTLLDASLYFGAILLVGGMAGIWIGGWLADRFGAARRRSYAIIPAIAFLAPCRSTSAAVTSRSLAVSFVLFLVPTALGLVWLGPVLSAIQHVVPPGMRATASAVFLFVNNLIGIGLGTVALGALSDVLVGALRRRLAALRDPRRHGVLLRRRGAVPAVGGAAGEGLEQITGPAPAQANPTYTRLLRLPLFSTLVTTTGPISPVAATCVPPQGCRSTPGISSRRMRPAPRGGCTESVRTSSGCRSSSSSVIHIERTAWLAATSALTAAVTASLSISSCVSKSSRPLSARDLPARDAVAQHRPHEVQAGVHAHVGVAAIPVEAASTVVPASGGAAPASSTCRMRPPSPLRVSATRHSRPSAARSTPVSPGCPPPSG